MFGFLGYKNLSYFTNTRLIFFCKLRPRYSHEMQSYVQKKIIGQPEVVITLIASFKYLL